MSRISFDFYDKYHVVISNHGYIQIYDKKIYKGIAGLALYQEDGVWKATDVAKDSLLLFEVDCDHEIVDNLSNDELRSIAKSTVEYYMMILAIRRPKIFTKMLKLNFEFDYQD